jgi:lysophospholipase L1-like esterase
VERARRHERWFKLLIVLLTCFSLGLVLTTAPWWWIYWLTSIPSSTRHVGRRVLGLATPRSEIDAEWRIYRQSHLAATRRRVERFYARATPAEHRLLQYARMDPEHGLLRWANFNGTLLFSSAVFEADDHGRAYRFRPLTRSIWLMHPPFGQSLLMLVPDGPGLADAVKGTTAVPLETSRQTTNSWGLRGPEPDLDASLRGIVLGDSYMQGVYVGDGETPPECLGRYLAGHKKTSVSILNTGVMGYSPEQYYYSLVAFADRFRPRFVVVSVFANDFGDFRLVATAGAGDWYEGRYWLEKIVQFCRARRCLCLIVPAPYEESVLNRRNTGHYPGNLANILAIPSLMFLDPIDDFVNADLKLQNDSPPPVQTSSRASLFNSSLGDSHFSPAGAAVWADSVGRRLALLLDRDPKPR